MEAIEGSEERRKQLDDWMNERRRDLRMKWTHVAKRAGMSVQNLLRIRKGQISISWDAASKLDEAFQWEKGGVEGAVLHGRRPTSVNDPIRGATSRRADLPPDWSAEEERAYQEKYPTLYPMLLTQGLTLDRWAWRWMADENAKLSALEQFTQSIRSDMDSGHPPGRGTPK